MGKFLSSHVSCPDKIISSTASRAFYTALHLADNWQYPEEGITITPKLYHADVENMIDLIRKEEDDVVALVGHNPGFTDLLNELTNSAIDNIPTCGVVGIEFPVDRWSNIPQRLGKISFFHTPKSIR